MKELFKMDEEELEMAEERMDDAYKLLELASLQLQRYRPFYGTLIAAMPVVPATKWLSTMATDGRTLYFNPEFLAGFTPERLKRIHARVNSNPELNAAQRKLIIEYLDIFYRPKTPREVIFAIEHEIRHIVCEHALRSYGFDADLFNDAADYYINISLIIEHSKADRFGQPFFPKGKDSDFNDPIYAGGEFEYLKYLYIDKKYDGWITEDIYADIVKNGIPKNDKDGSPKGGDQHQKNDGSVGKPSQDTDEDVPDAISHGDIADALGIDTDSQPELTEEGKKANDKVMRRAIENAVREAGSGAPPEARKFVDEMGSPKINYLRLLKRTLVSLVKGNVSYQRLSRRSYSLTKAMRAGGYIGGSQTVALPKTMNQKTIRVHIYFDVSGSFNDSMLAPVKREIRGLCNQYDQFEVTLAAWSTKVGNVCTYTKQNLKDMDNYKIVTTYGTDVSCVFEHMDTLKDPVDQVIIFTDGYFSDVSKKKDWAKKYDKKCLWIILGDLHRFKCDFGKTIIFDKYVK